MPNPDSGNLDSQLGNRPPKFSRKKGAPSATVNEKTAAWPGPGKTQPRDRSAGISRVTIHPKSEGL